MIYYCDTSGVLLPTNFFLMLLHRKRQIKSKVSQGKLEKKKRKISSSYSSAWFAKTEWNMMARSKVAWACRELVQLHLKTLVRNLNNIWRGYLPGVIFTEFMFKTVFWFGIHYFIRQVVPLSDVLRDKILFNLSFWCVRNFGGLGIVASWGSIGGNEVVYNPHRRTERKNFTSKCDLGLLWDDVIYLTIVNLNICQ